jgi:hypothetical protein
MMNPIKTIGILILSMIAVGMLSQCGGQTLVDVFDDYVKIDPDSKPFSYRLFLSHYEDLNEAGIITSLEHRPFRPLLAEEAESRSLAECLSDSVTSVQIFPTRTDGLRNKKLLIIVHGFHGGLMNNAGQIIQYLVPGISHAVDEQYENIKDETYKALVKSVRGEFDLLFFKTPRGSYGKADEYEANEYYQSKYVTLEEMGRMLKEVITYFMDDYDEIAIFAHSLGALLAYYAVLDEMFEQVANRYYNRIATYEMELDILDQLSQNYKSIDAVSSQAKLYYKISLCLQALTDIDLLSSGRRYTLVDKSLLGEAYINPTRVYDFKLKGVLFIAPYLGGFSDWMRGILGFTTQFTGNKVLDQLLSDDFRKKLMAIQNNFAIQNFEKDFQLRFFYDPAHPPSDQPQREQPNYYPRFVFCLPENDTMLNYDFIRTGITHPENPSLVKYPIPLKGLAHQNIFDIQDFEQDFVKVMFTFLHDYLSLEQAQAASHSNS